MSTSDYITPKHYEAIGTLIAMCSCFEAQMAQGIIALSGTTKQASIIMTIGMNAKALINNLRHLARLKAPHLADEFNKIIDGDDRNRGLDKLYPVRNLFAHAIFGPGAAKGSIKPLAFRLREDMEFQEGEFDVAGILLYAKMFQERSIRLRKLLNDNGYSYDEVPEDAE